MEGLEVRSTRKAEIADLSPSALFTDVYNYLSAELSSLSARDNAKLNENQMVGVYCRD